MAFKARDGKSFGNRQQMKAYDERVPKGKGASHAEPDGDEPGQGEGDDVSAQPIHEVVEEHGPAHKIVLHHGAEDHKVRSYHGEPPHHVVHRSQHPSAEEAHDHAAQAAGIGSELDAGEKTGQPMSTAGSPGSASEYGIPGM